jgi:hypothetical protein
MWDHWPADGADGHIGAMNTENTQRLEKHYAFSIQIWRPDSFPWSTSIVETKLEDGCAVSGTAVTGVCAVWDISVSQVSFTDQDRLKQPACLISRCIAHLVSALVHYCPPSQYCPLPLVSHLLSCCTPQEKLPVMLSSNAQTHPVSHTCRTAGVSVMQSLHLEEKEKIY